MAEDKKINESGEVVEETKSGAEIKVAKRPAKTEGSSQVKQSGVKVSGPKG